MDNKRADVVIVGGGIVGCSTAVHLRKAGWDVTLLERQTIGVNASGRNGGGVRQQNRDPRELPLAMASVRMWHTLSEELDHDVEYRPDGVAVLAFTQDRLGELTESAKHQRRAGLPVETIGPAELARLFPGMGPQACGANYCALDGHANPLATMRAYQMALSRLGVPVYEGAEVTGFERGKGGEVTAVVANRVRVEARRVVIAAGPWSDGLCRLLGRGLPTMPKQPEMMVSERVAPFIRGMISGPHGYLRQSVSGHIHFGINSKPTRRLDFAVRPESMGNLAGNLLDIYPRIGEVRILRTWSGLTAWTPDGIPIIDRHPDAPGTFVAAAFCGHGFALGPAVGAVVASMVQGEEPPVSPAPFSLSRF
jgi:sarcosine oxidase subunit beta